MDNIYDNNTESNHGPFGKRQIHAGPYGGKETDNLSDKKAAAVFSPAKDIRPAPKQ